MHSRAEENYLKAIYHLQRSKKGGIATNAIARAMRTKPSSVTDMVQKLADKNLVVYQKYKGAALTVRGKKAAAHVIRKHRLWEVFLSQKLNFNWGQVHDIAEQLEHVQSKELIQRLDQYLGHPTTDPHGDPIPDTAGNIRPTAKKTLSQFEKKQHGVCVGVKGAGSEFLQYLDKKNIAI
ncbi:MAG: metal-dependent transcriptional regulator, partial [Marinirhabdus sp.]